MSEQMHKSTFDALLTQYARKHVLSRPISPIPNGYKRWKAKAYHENGEVYELTHGPSGQLVARRISFNRRGISQPVLDFDRPSYSSSNRAHGRNFELNDPMLPRRKS